MKASHQFYNLLLLWAGILDLEMIVYHGQKQVDIVDWVSTLIDLIASDILSLVMRKNPAACKKPRGCAERCRTT